MIRRGGGRHEIPAVELHVRGSMLEAMVKLLLVLVAACATAEWFWWFVGAAVLGVVVWLAVRGYKTTVAEIEADQQKAAEIVARADEQHAWALAGDDRGIYGFVPPEL